MNSACSTHGLASVVICTTGLRNTLPCCLESLLADHCTNREILVIVNGPISKSLAKLLSEYPVRVAREDKRGVSWARNTGAKLATGEYVLLLDDDVVVHPGWTHALLAPFSDPEVACVSGRLIPRGQGYHQAARYFTPGATSNWKLSRDDKNALAKALSSDAGFGCNLAFRRDFVIQTVPFPVDLGAGSKIGAGDEHYMFVQVLNHGRALFHAGDAVVTHRFEDSDQVLRQRMLSMYSSTLALRLRLFTDVPRFRIALASEFVKNVRKFFFADHRPSDDPRRGIGLFAALRAYLRGVWLFLSR